MKTVQEWLRETDAEQIIATYLINHPIDFLMLHNKDATVALVFDAAKENLRGMIQHLLSLEAVPSEDDIFYAVRVIEGQNSRVNAELSRRDEILKDDLPEHYAWEFTDWRQVLGWRIAGTKLTLDHMDDVLADILFEMSFFGSDHERWKQRKAEIETSLDESMEEIRCGNCRSAEEVFAEFGLPSDEPDEVADELEHRILLVEMEYDLYFRKREASKVRKLLQDELQ